MRVSTPVHMKKPDDFKGLSDEITTRIRTAVSDRDPSPETGFLHCRSCVVKTSFGHIPSNEQSKRGVLITVI